MNSKNGKMINLVFGGRGIMSSLKGNFFAYFSYKNLDMEAAQLREAR